MSVEQGLATVHDLTALIADAHDRREFSWLFQQLGDLRATLVEPPSNLLPSVFDQVDRAGRLGWARPAAPRWIAYASGIAASAAGAAVLATRTRRAN